MCFYSRINAPGNQIKNGKELSYIPPLPWKGTGFHRFCLAVFAHDEPVDLAKINESSNNRQDKFMILLRLHFTTAANSILNKLSYIEQFNDNKILCKISVLSKNGKSSCSFESSYLKAFYFLVPSQFNKRSLQSSSLNSCSSCL